MFTSDSRTPGTPWSQMSSLRTEDMTSKQPLANCECACCSFKIIARSLQRFSSSRKLRKESWCGHGGWLCSSRTSKIECSSSIVPDISLLGSCSNLLKTSIKSVEKEYHNAIEHEPQIVISSLLLFFAVHLRHGRTEDSSVNSVQLPLWLASSAIATVEQGLQPFGVVVVVRSKPCQIGVSGLLVTRIRIRMSLQPPTYSSKPNDIPILPSSSHSSKASIATKIVPRQRLDN
jgi:hypothetical protein